MIAALRGISTLRDPLRLLSLRSRTCGVCGCLLRPEETCPMCRWRLLGDHDDE